MKAVTRVLATASALSICLVAAAPVHAVQPFSSPSPASADVEAAPVTLRSWPVLREGSNSLWSPVTVRSLQYLLNAHGARLVVDGIFGPATDAATRAFQRVNGLTVDGIVGSATWSRAIVTVRRGSTGQAVRAVQEQINHRNLRGWGFLAVDGVFGPRTEASVRGFQTGMTFQLPFTVDGIVGPNTWKALIVGWLAG